MNKILLAVLWALLAVGFAIAQDTPGAAIPPKSENQNSQMSSQSSATPATVVRGCVSGSAGNFTLTDQNGMQYKLVGDDTALQSKVGHEVEVNGSENQSSEASSQGGEATAHASNSIQVAGVRDVASSCGLGRSNGSQPMSDSSGENPKETPTTSEPATPPQPQLIAMLQQSSTATSGAQSTNNPPQEASPPVTSQTPAAPSSPTGANSQVGNSPANNTGMTESQANHDAQAARQGELNSNPQNGETTGRGVNNQGVNNPSTTNPNAVPSSPNSASPQSNTNDQNKPLYERQATDIPWANTTTNGNTGGNGTNPPQ